MCFVLISCTAQVSIVNLQNPRARATNPGPRRHPTCWASSQWSHTVSSTPCHGAWTSAPLSTHPSIECKRTAPQIETPICTHRTTSHQFIWQQHHTWGAVGGSPMECRVDGQPHKTPHFHPRHRHPPEWPSQEEPGSGLTASAPVSDVSAPACTNGVDLLCGLWVWRRRTNHRPYCSPASNPSTSPWTAWPEGSGRWDNRIGAQHLPRDLVRPSSEAQTLHKKYRKKYRFKWNYTGQF